MRIEPRQRMFDVRPDRLDEREIARAFVVSASQHHEERCRVDAPVVAGERHLVEVGHLALARLVQNLPGLRVAGLVVLGRLRRRQIRQDAPGERRIHPQEFER
jgi:hypothetical protein